MISPNPVPCSIAINAPVLLSAKFDTALTISFTYIFLCSLSTNPCLSSKALLPKCSNALLISGWNIITTDIIPIVNVLLNIKYNILKFKIALIGINMIINAIPFNSCSALVSFINIYPL